MIYDGDMAQKKKIKVAVLMGGPSAEHEVSLHTGEEVVKNLDPRTYIAEPVMITKTGKWIVVPERSRLIGATAVGSRARAVRALAERAGSREIVERKTDVVFIALHGKYGEDGTVQGLLDAFGMPYTGSGVLASALGMDKPRSLAIFREAGLLVPDFEIVTRAEARKRGQNFMRHAIRRFGLPLAVKPADHGSSVGVSIVRKKKQLSGAIREAGKYAKEIIVQKYVKGRELTCGVLEEKTGRLLSLPPIEIVPKLGVFYDYQSKYTDGGSEHIIPPHNLPQKTISAVQAAACTAHRALGCRGMSRTDFILDARGDLYVLEINTIPGMTSTSLLPQAAAAADIPFPKLLDMLIAAALKKF